MIPTIFQSVSSSKIASYFVLRVETFPSPRIILFFFFFFEIPFGVTFHNKPWSMEQFLTLFLLIIVFLSISSIDSYQIRSSFFPSFLLSVVKDDCKSSWEETHIVPIEKTITIQQLYIGHSRCFPNPDPCYSQRLFDHNSYANSSIQTEYHSISIVFWYRCIGTTYH